MRMRNCRPGCVRDGSHSAPLECWSEGGDGINEMQREEGSSRAPDDLSTGCPECGAQLGQRHADGCTDETWRVNRHKRDSPLTRAMLHESDREGGDGINEMQLSESFERHLERQFEPDPPLTRAMLHESDREEDPGRARERITGFSSHIPKGSGEPPGVISFCGDPARAPEHYVAKHRANGIEPGAEMLDWVCATRGRDAAINYLRVELQTKATRLGLRGEEAELRDVFKIEQACAKLRGLILGGSDDAAR